MPEVQGQLGQPVPCPGGAVLAMRGEGAGRLLHQGAKELGEL